MNSNTKIFLYRKFVLIKICKALKLITGMYDIKLKIISNKQRGAIRRFLSLQAQIKIREDSSIKVRW